MTSNSQLAGPSTRTGPLNDGNSRSGDGLLQFVTSTGSTYQVDLRDQQVRRLTGTHAPTARQGEDGTWRHYLHITPITLGAQVVIIWRHTAQGTAEATITSAVVHVEQVPPCAGSTHRG